jgi:6-phosphogluconate dehydrogenase (decarboxylating)
MQDLEGGLSDAGRWQGKEQTDSKNNTPHVKTSLVERFLSHEDLEAARQIESRPKG